MLILTVFLFIIITIAVIKIISLTIHSECKSKVCLLGKTALVTGGSSGIGYRIVLELVQRGCRVIIADKIQDKNLLENIFKETHSRNVTFKYVDLSSFDSVRKFAKVIVEDEDKLDILINNAGIGRHVSTITENYLDIVMQVNYFSAFLLTHLLVDLVKKAKGRIIFTSSLLAFLHQFSLEKLKTDGFNSIEYGYHYPNSKLCLLMASEIFAEKLKNFGVTSNTYHPGIVNTNIFTNSLQIKGHNYFLATAIRTLGYLSILIGKSPEQGAQTALHLACSNDVVDVTGEFFAETKAVTKPKILFNKNFCRKVWEATEEIVKLNVSEKL